MTKQLLAPNRKPSNLNAEQYDLVRTTAFKNWFGDWEKLALTKFYDSGIDEVSLSKLESKVSKVVDENGEPLVVYHGTNEYAYFRSLNANEKIYLDPKKSKFAPRTVSGGVYFTSKINVAETFSDMDFVLECFLSLKKPKVINGYEKNMSEIISESSPINYGNNDSIIVKNTYDVIGGIDRGKNFISDIFIVKKSNQIKLADGTNTTFDSENDDIRFDNGGATESSTPDYLRMFLDN